MNRLQKFINEVGGAELARRLDCSKQLVSHWRVGRQRPTAEMTLRIESIADGAITRADIRPDLWGTAA